MGLRWEQQDTRGFLTLKVIVFYISPVQKGPILQPPPPQGDSSSYKQLHVNPDCHHGDGALLRHSWVVPAIVLLLLYFHMYHAAVDFHYLEFLLKVVFVIRVKSIRNYFH